MAKCIHLFLRFHDCFMLAKMKIFMLWSGDLVDQLKWLGVASRGRAVGKSGGVHGLPAPKILTCTIKQKTDFFFFLNQRYYLKIS